MIPGHTQPHYSDQTLHKRLNLVYGLIHMWGIMQPGKSPRIAIAAMKSETSPDKGVSLWTFKIPWDPLGKCSIFLAKLTVSAGSALASLTNSTPAGHPIPTYVRKRGARVMTWTGWSWRSFLTLWFHQYQAWDSGQQSKRGRNRQCHRCTIGMHKPRIRAVEEASTLLSCLVLPTCWF